MTFKVEIVPSPKSELGEGPHWDDKTQSLYYVDIYGKGESILRYDYKENKVYSAKVDGEEVVSFIIPVANTIDQYAVGIRKRVGIVEWDGVSPKAKLGPIAFEVDEDDNNRFNDAKADPMGRFYGKYILKCNLWFCLKIYFCKLFYNQVEPCVMNRWVIYLKWLAVHSIAISKVKV